MTARRPVLAVVLTVGLLAAPLAAGAQPAAKAPRIGFLVGGSEGDPLPSADAFRQGLRGLGYVEGRNIVIEYRYAEGRLERFPDLASGLVRLPVDMIVAPSTAAALAARKATASIPIVLVLAGNPVGDGLIKGFARPGGNATGLTMSVGPEIGSKFLELLKETVPTVSRVAVLSNPLTAPHAGMLKEMETAAQVLGLAIQSVSARRPDEIDGAFAAMSRARADGLIVLPDAMFDSVRVGARIRDSAAKGRFPTMYGIREHAEAGGLMSYGPSVPDLYRRAAGYVDRILKGAKPADLPVERPSKFDLIVNLKTVKALGLTVPPSVLARADEIIE
jgi:putative ABC transport system substrate-binding protein